MKRFQVKCRRCRHWLMSEESIVDCHSDSVQGDVTRWGCGDNGEQITRSHLFVSLADTPAFITTFVEQACYTQGKITCPKCQGRLGSFDFVRTARKCACGRSVLPPVHLLRDRVDLLPSSSPSSLLPHATLVTPCTHSLAGLHNHVSNGPQEEGQGGKGVEIGSAEHGVSVDSLSCEKSLDGEEQSATEKKIADEICVAIINKEENAFGDDSDCGDDVIVDIRWLFEQSPSQQQSLSSIFVQNTEKHSTSVIHSCQCHFNACQCHSENTASETAPQNSDVTTQSSPTLQNTARIASCLQQKRKVIVPSYQDYSKSRDYPLQRPDSGIDCAVASMALSITPLSKKGRREMRRRNKCRDGDVQEELKSMIASDMAEASVHFPVARPHQVSSYGQREKERREREAEEKQQIQNEELLWDHTCPMCLDVMWSPHAALPCAHNFCEGCLRRLTTVSSPTKTDCPLCRQRIAQCVPNADLEKSIRDKYPAHLRLRRREEKRQSQRFRHTPLPGLPFPHRFLSHLPGHRLHLSRTCRKWLTVVVVSVVVVVSLSSVGMAICKRVLHKLAEVYDDWMERLTGERLWSHFMGGESRMLTVSCVFVLYLLVACVVHYLQLFRHIIN